MKRMKSCAWVLAVVGVLGSSAALRAQHHHEGDFEIGQSGAPLHQLLLHGDPDILSGEEAIHLLPGEGLFEGMFAADDPGWIGAEEDEPNEGLYLLLPGHQVSLKRIGFDAGFSIFDPTSGPILEADGDQYLFPLDGEGFIHRHLIFVGDGLEGDPWSATFQLVDPSGVHAFTEPFTLSFVAVPEPATVSLLVLGAVGLLRRR